MVNRVQQREEGGGVRHRRQEEAGPCTLLHSSRVIYLIVFLSTQPAVQLGRLQHKRGWRSVKPPHQQKPNKSGRWSRVCYLFCKTLTQHISYLTSSRCSNCVSHIPACSSQIAQRSESRVYLIHPSVGVVPASL